MTNSFYDNLSFYDDSKLETGPSVNAGGGGFNPAMMGQFAQMLPMIGNMFGGSENQQAQPKTFIPMQNAQMQSAKPIEPVLDKGMATKRNLYNYIMGQGQ